MIVLLAWAIFITTIASVLYAVGRLQGWNAAVRSYPAPPPPERVFVGLAPVNVLEWLEAGADLAHAEVAREVEEICARVDADPERWAHR